MSCREEASPHRHALPGRVLPRRQASGMPSVSECRTTTPGGRRHGGRDRRSRRTSRGGISGARTHHDSHRYQPREKTQHPTIQPAAADHQPTNAARTADAPGGIRDRHSPHRRRGDHGRNAFTHLTVRRCRRVAAVGSAGARPHWDTPAQPPARPWTVPDPTRPDSDRVATCGANSDRLATCGANSDPDPVRSLPGPHHPRGRPR